MHRPTFMLAGMSALALLVGAVPAQAAQLQILLPLGRTAYQTNEIIDISVVRTDTQALAAGPLVLTAAGTDGSKMSFTFPVAAEALAGSAASRTENLHLNGYLLRPGHYAIDVASDGATATSAIDVYSDVRASTYKTVHWGGPSGANMGPEGVGGLDFNIELSGDTARQEPSIAAGEDVLGNCLMGGGHQFGLKWYNDWSDPNVYLGADVRGLDRAFSFRTLPNAIGAHLYDEPGLTWMPNPHYLDPKTGQPISNDQDVPPQRAAQQRAFGHEPLWSDQVDVNNPAQYAEWEQQNDFKLGFMDAFWKSANEGLSRLKPGYFAVTQSQYGWSALYDGYYFNVARSLPVISGHGGYNDFWLRNLNPSFFLEMALPRQLDKPTWYLPRWGNDDNDEVRLEQNMSFITGIQGISSPPGLNVKSIGAPATAESNRLYQKIGTIFSVPEYTNQAVTILYSKSNQFYQKIETSPNLGTVYLATKLLQYPIQVVLEEDVLDGSLAANHKAIIVSGVKHLDAPVINGLADFAKDGGTVLVTADVPFTIPGAVVLPLDPDAKERAAQAAAKASDDAAKALFENNSAAQAAATALGDASKSLAGAAASLTAAAKTPKGVDKPTIDAAKALTDAAKALDADAKAITGGAKSPADLDAVTTNADQAVATAGAVDGDIAKTHPDVASAMAAASKAAAAADKAAPGAEKAAEAADKAKAEAFRINTFNFQLANAKPLAALIKAALEKAGVKPAFGSDVPTIAAGHQVRGDIDYTFAVNMTVDPNDQTSPTGPGWTGGVGVPVATTARITLPNDGRPVYDAVTGQEVPFKNGVATLSFGPGQMYAFAQPIHPIGGVQVGGPVVNRDFTRTADPQHVEITASLVDGQQKLIAGNCPMEVKVTDPLGVVRYDVYRCAEHGVLNTTLPLAANDPAGTWNVTVSELLSGKQGMSTFTYDLASQCGDLAGETHRAVVFGDDIPNIYKFFRDHRNITIVAGSSPWDADAAQRLVDIFKPYDVTATIVPMATANQALPITDEQAATWCGYNDGVAGRLDAAARKDPHAVGYNLPGPTILVGNAADNPLISWMTAQSVLPYKVTPDFPGVGQGMVAWNLMCLGHDIESIAIIGNDADGINEAVGTAFQYGIGVDPLTPYALPTSSSLVAATTAAPAPVATASAFH